MDEEKLYIANLAVMKYNEQYGFNYDYRNFEVVSIPPNTNTDFAFEIYTRRFDDYLRLRVYFTIGNYFFISPYRIYDQPNTNTGIGDEIFVTDSVADDVFLSLTNNLIRQSSPNLTEDASLLPIIIQEENGLPILMESGDYILREEGN